jgi:hypothetical protein
MIAASCAVLHCQGAPASLRLSGNRRRARDQQRTSSASDLADSGTDSPYLRKQTSRIVDPCEQPERGSSRGGEKGTCPPDSSRKRFADQLCTPPKPVLASTSKSGANHWHTPPHKSRVRPSHANDRRRSCGPPLWASLASLRLAAHCMCNDPSSSGTGSAPRREQHGRRRRPPGGMCRTCHEPQ